MPDRDEAIAARSILVPARVAVAATFLRKRGVNVYRCPVCGRVFRHDDTYEPICSGPGALDTHPLTVMAQVQVAEPLRQW